ncbi:restriction endonuclease subunit S [Flavobacteriaceae bacterium F89]|uniref:Restriction endonuclease subunit S n=1 Tax=Cerina litoralis TaxID=2874477 RepID=A0AAE3EYS7_9FLAO|nr:restriction endonuclease subunit S [Cerina litoralis]MCG2462202.1 restriction endonuclease subunit S [Cerina litoralis]
MQQEKRLVPQLRFPEFDGEWEKKKLGDVAKVTSGGTPNRSKNQYWGGDLPWLTTSLIDFNLITKAEEFITNEGLENSSAKLFPVGTLLMAMYGQGKTRGKIGVLGIKASTNQACGAIVPSKTIKNYFLFQNLAGRYDEIRNLSNDGGQQNISLGIIKSLKFAHPSLPEQQKIADFLSAVDTRIQSLEKKKSLLKIYKKGVMQKIFTQEIRFRDDTSTPLSASNGQEFPEWEKKKLGDILIEVNDKSTISNQYPILSSTAKGLFNQSDYFKKDVASKDNTGYKILKKHQLVLSPQNLWLGNINVNCDFAIGAVSPSYKVFDFNKNLTSFEFCKYLLFTNRMFYEYSQASEQGASIVRRNLDMLSFVAIPIKLPTPKEQAKIANFLSVLDKRIGLVTEQIEKTKTYKKGLLQQMFV